jgi:hypothetical protein
VAVEEAKKLAADGKQKQAEELLQEQAQQPSPADSPNKT